MTIILLSSVFLKLGKCYIFLNWVELKNLFRKRMINSS